MQALRNKHKGSGCIIYKLFFVAKFLMVNFIYKIIINFFKFKIWQWILSFWVYTYFDPKISVFYFTYKIDKLMLKWSTKFFLNNFFYKFDLTFKLIDLQNWMRGVESSFPMTYRRSFFSDLLQNAIRGVEGALINH